MDEAWLGIAEAGQRFRDRALSPVELVRALLARIDQLDPRCNAFLRLMPESALAEAKQRLGYMPHANEDAAAEARLVYVAMTRAVERLVCTCHRDSAFAGKVEAALHAAGT